MSGNPFEELDKAQKAEARGKAFAELDAAEGATPVAPPTAGAGAPAPVNGAPQDPPPPEDPVEQEISGWESLKAGLTDPWNLGAEARAYGASVAADPRILRTAVPLLAELQTPADPIVRQTERGTARDAPIDPRSEYDVARDESDAELESYREANPWRYGLGQFVTETASQLPATLMGAGPAAAAIAEADAAAPAASRLAQYASRAAARAKPAIAVAAPNAALSSFGSSEADLTEDPGQVAEDTAIGTGLGTAAGVLGGELLYGLRAGKRWIGQRAQRAEADRIGAAHGKQAADDMLAAADPNSAAGREMRRKVLEAEAPGALESTERQVFEELSKLSPAQGLANAPRALREPARVAPAIAASAGRGGAPNAEMQLLQEWAQSQPGHQLAALEGVLGRRAEGVAASQALDAAQRNLPPPGFTERMGKAVSGIGAGMLPGAARETVGALRSQPSSLAQAARTVAQLESQGPTNLAAQRALAAMGRESDGQLGTVTRAALPGVATPALRAREAAAEGSGRGHRLESVIADRILIGDGSLGPYEARLRQAKQKGSLGTELFKLQGDPGWASLRERLLAETEED